MGKNKQKRPTTDAYYGSEADEYGSSRWMARNQIQTTLLAIKLLNAEELGGSTELSLGESMVLDIGCGTGYSTDAILSTYLNTIGIEISRDMLVQAAARTAGIWIQADMRHLPLRNTIFDSIISISAFNFASSGAHSLQEVKDLIRSAVTNVERVLTHHGKVVIEFYPTKAEEPLFLAEFKRIGMEGGLMIHEPQTKREKKFLLLKKP